MTATVVVAVIAPWPRARADDGATAWQRTAAQTLRKGSAAERRGVLGEIAHQTDPAAALSVALDGVLEAERRERDAKGERDDEGEKLFKFYSKYVLRTELPRERYTAYRVLEIENNRMSAALATLREETDLFVAAARTVSARVPPDVAHGEEFVVGLRALVTRARPSEAKALLVRSLRGAPLDGLVDDIHEWANTTTDRALSAAALTTLCTRPALVDAARLVPVAATPDPVLRRLVYRTLAASPGTESLDVLVAALGHEVGVPASEVTTLLRRITGRPLGEDPRGWSAWWAVQRSTWSASAAGDTDAGEFDRRERSRYFGLSLHSARVLFVLDRSLSMSWPITDDGDEELTREDLAAEDKFTVAKRELLSALDGLDETSSFNILVYGTKLDRFQARLVAGNGRNLAQARRFVERLELEGSTNLASALLAAMDVTRPGSTARDDDIADTLVVLTDGEPNCGPIADPEHLLREIRRQDPDHMVTIHTIFLGIAGDVDFMRRLAEQCGGRFVHHTR